VDVMTEYKKEAPSFEKCNWEERNHTIEDWLSKAIENIEQIAEREHKPIYATDNANRECLRKSIHFIRKAWDLVPDERKSVMDHSQSLSNKDIFHA